MQTQEFPIFKRQEAEVPGMNSGITHLVVSSGWITVIMVGNIIYRYNITDSRNIQRRFNVSIARTLRFLSWTLLCTIVQSLLGFSFNALLCHCIEIMTLD